MLSGARAFSLGFNLPYGSNLLGQIKSRYVGENEPHVIDIKVGIFNVGDVLTKSYINSIKSKEDKEKAHQYNRRTIFNILRDDYVPNKNDELKRK